MVEIGLIAALAFVLVAIVASYLLKLELKKMGAPENSIEIAAFVAIGMPPIKSVNSKLLAQKSPEGLSNVGKASLYACRASLFLAVLSVTLGAIFGLSADA